jgi:phosphoribosylformylglycinamidine (FGAM) synthase-like enzyme
MYVDGHLPGSYGETNKVSALESLQFSVTSVIGDINRCVTLDTKMDGDLVYVLGLTRNELGASEYYDMLGHMGRNVPQVAPDDFMPLYRSLADAIEKELVASAHGIYRGGLAVHLAMTAMAGGLGMTVDLATVPAENNLREDTLLYAESAGRFIVTIAPTNRAAFENLFSAMPMACIGRVTSEPQLTVNGADGKPIVNLTLPALKAAWQKTFGDLI